MQTGKFVFWGQTMLMLKTSLALLALPGLVYAHSGGRDSYGCHNNTALGVYECHSGQFAGRSWPNPGGKTAMLAELNTPPPDTPPVAPVLVGGATLAWTPNAEADLAGYKLYWGTTPGAYNAPIDLGKVTEIVLPNLLRGATYYFAITAYDTAGNESGKSNVVSKHVP